MQAEAFMDCVSELWEGTVLVSVSIAQSDSTSNEVLDSVHVLVSRFSYLPVLLEEVVSNFQQNAIEFSSDVWFQSSEEEPLRCHIPAGVLYDLYAKGRTPWEIVVHFQHFPSQLLLKCSTPVEAEHFYFHSLKQAVFLLHGSTRLFNELSVEVQRSLWQSVRTSNRSVFLSIADQMVTAGRLDRGAVGELKSVPIRVVRKDKPVVQKPVAPFFPHTASAGGAVGVDSADVEVPRSLRDVLLSDLAGPLDFSADTVDSLTCIIQGIEVPLESPVFDLWRLMRHCDLFLYVIIR